MSHKRTYSRCRPTRSYAGRCKGSLSTRSSLSGAPSWIGACVSLGYKRCVKELHIDKLEALSAMLTQMTLPVATLPNSVVSTEGDFLRRGRLHRVTRATDCFGMQCLHLMPAPLPGYTEDDLEPAPLDGTSLTMYVPRPSAVYAGILRMMLKYPRWCAEQYKLQADLELLVYYNMLGPEKMSAGYELEEREMDRRGMEAAEPVRGWGREGQWREGEEWMEDALVGIVTGEKDITSLPHLGTMAHGKIA